MQEEIFSLGTTSRFIANQLSNLPAARTRRKVGVLKERERKGWELSPILQSAANRCSLVLVDRTLDLMAACSHPTDSLADRVLSLLPHCPVDSNDVCVDMGPIAISGISNRDFESGACIVHGSLAQPGNAKAQQLLKTLIHSKQKVFPWAFQCTIDFLALVWMWCKM